LFENLKVSLLQTSNLQ